MQCLHCQKYIHEKPWNHLTNMLDYDEKGNEIFTDKYICGYICYRRLREGNILPSNLWQHIVNKEDYKGLISPIIPQKHQFQFLTHEELRGMGDDDVEKYYQERENQIYMDPELIDIHEELFNEDKRTEFLERESSGEETFDDY